MNKKVISVDLGASSGRIIVVIYDGDKFYLDEIYRFGNQTYLKDNHLFWDFSLLFNNIKIGISKAFNKYKDISSIGIDGWGVDYGLLDGDGVLLSNPYCYRDERTINIMNDFEKKLTYKEVYNITGIQKLHFNTIFQLYCEKDIIKKANNIMLLPDLIAYLLTGNMRCELTNLSTTSLYDQNTKSISKEILNKLNISERAFPKIIYPCETYGDLLPAYLNDEYFDANIPVIAVCSHDTASAVLGVNATNKNFLYISSGTWSLIGTELDNPIINENSYKLNFTNEIGFAGTTRLLKNTMGMFLVNELRKEWRNLNAEVKKDKIPQIINECPDIEKYINLDSLQFESPGNMICKINEYLKNTKQSLPTFQGQWLRMIYQSMAIKYKIIIDELMELTNKNFEEIIIVGGGNLATVLNQYIANATNMKVKTGPIEATVVGNACAQFISLGIIESKEKCREIINKSFESITYYPQEQDVWRKKYKNYLKIIKMEKKYGKK